MEFAILGEVRRQGGEEVLTTDLLSGLQSVFPDLDKKTLNSELYRMDGKTLDKTAEPNGTKPRWTLRPVDDPAERLEQLKLIQEALEEEIRELEGADPAPRKTTSKGGDVARGKNRRRGKAKLQSLTSEEEAPPKPKAKVISRAKKHTSDEEEEEE